MEIKPVNAAFIKENQVTRGKESKYKPLIDSIRQHRYVAVTGLSSPQVNAATAAVRKAGLNIGTAKLNDGAVAFFIRTESGEK